MKKIIVFLFVIIFGISLSSCNKNEYKVSVTGSKDSLIEKIKTSYKAGTKVEIKSHVVDDATLYVFVNDVEIPMSHYDSDYWEYEFIMPSEDVVIYLTFDQFYGTTDYTFSDLYYWVNTLGKRVDKVSMEKKNEMGQGELENIEYSTNEEEDIACFLAILDQPLTKYDEEIIETGVKKIISFYIGEEVYSISFVDNYLFWNDFSTYQYFQFKNVDYSLPSITK